MWLKSPLINCRHGFSTRTGGFTEAPFNKLYPGGTVDAPALTEKNRETALSELGLSVSSLCTLQQEHGTGVCIARKGNQTGDALVTSEKELVLAVRVADCYPLLFYDEINQVAGVAHAGWRGVCGGIAGKTIIRMRELGADPGSIKVAIGPGICQEHFEVGPEVITQFVKAGFPDNCWHDNQLSLIKCIFNHLQKQGIKDTNIWTMNRCSFENEFYSYRRDKGITGRMWALISL
jgi:polyphenol oxidase